MSRPLHWLQELKTVASLLHTFPLVKFVLLKSGLHLKPVKKKKKEKKFSLYQKLETDEWLLIFCAALISHAVTNWSGTTARFSRAVVQIQRFGLQWEIGSQCSKPGEFGIPLLVCSVQKVTLPVFAIISNTFLALPKRLSNVNSFTQT